MHPCRQFPSHSLAAQGLNGDAKNRKVSWSFCGPHALVLALLFCVALLFSCPVIPGGGCTESSFGPRFARVCEGTVTYSRLLDKVGGRGPYS